MKPARCASRLSLSPAATATKLGFVTALIEPQGGVVRYCSDVEGNVTRVKDALDHLTGAGCNRAVSAA